MYLQALNLLTFTVLPLDALNSFSYTYFRCITMSLIHCVSLICQSVTECWPQHNLASSLAMWSPCMQNAYSVVLHLSIIYSWGSSFSYYVYIYAFIVLKMHINAPLTHICIYKHILHIFAYFTIWRYHINLANCTHNVHMGEHSIGTRVDFLQSVRMQVTYVWSREWCCCL